MINRMQPYHTEGRRQPLLTDQEDAESERTQTSGLLQFEELVRTHPIAAISVGLLGGLTLGWWVKRK